MKTSIIKGCEMEEVRFVIKTDYQDKYTELDILQKFLELGADITTFRITRQRRPTKRAVDVRQPSIRKNKSIIGAHQ